MRTSGIVELCLSSDNILWLDELPAQIDQRAGGIDIVANLARQHQRLLKRLGCAFGVTHARQREPIGQQQPGLWLPIPSI